MQDRKVSRRGFLKTSIGLASTAGLVSGCSRDEIHRNVLFIVVDDLNTALGCYGSSVVQTPHIDQLASNGVRFDHAYCQTPLCNPSRASFLTGLRPNLTGVLDNKTSFKETLPNAVTLPRLFKQHSFVTAGFGKVFHKSKYGDPKAWDLRGGGPGTNWDQIGERRNITDGRLRWSLWVAAEGDASELHDTVITTKAINFLNTIEEPFFLAVGFKRPHDPLIAPKKYFDLYPLEKLPIHRLPDERSQISPIAFGSKKASLEEFEKFTELDKREFLRAYYACVSFVDDQVGRIMDALYRLDLLKTTTIVFTSDHGYHHGEQNWWNKATLFESATKVPLIVSTPKSQKGVSCNEFIELIDLYPTLADIYGLKPPNNISGKSFKSLLTLPNTEFKDAAYSQIRFGEHTGYSIRTARWRFTTWDMGAAGEELYDHTNDPHEYQNLALEPNNKAIVDYLKERIRNELNVQS